MCSLMVLLVPALPRVARKLDHFGLRQTNATAAELSALLSVPGTHLLPLPAFPMTRSKRKAAQGRSAPAPDFAKKKPRLGARPKSSNQTSVSFKSRQVYVPAQGRQPTPASKPGLTLPELLQRARHYNAATRLAAFNGLVRAVSEKRAAAHLQARLQLSAVLAPALDALCDDSPPVRRASRQLVVACVALLPDVRPFARLLAATLNAALSHIRRDIRVDAATTVTDVLAVHGVTPQIIFRDDAGNPLDALKDLLALVTGAKGRVHALQAVAAMCGRGPTEHEADVKDTPRKRTPRVFYYQRCRRVPRVGDTATKGTPALLLRMPVSVAGDLLVRVTYLGMECLPLAECRRNEGKRELLTATAVALRALTCAHSLTGRARPALKQLLKEWADEARRGGSGRGLALAERALAATALAAGEPDVAGQFLLRALGGGGEGADVDALVRAYLREGKGTARAEVASRWAGVLAERGDSGDAGWVERGAGTLFDVLDAMEVSERGETVESAARVGMDMARREEWEAGRRVLAIVARELRGDAVDEEVRRRVGEVIAKGVESGGGIGDRDVAEEMAACVFYGGVAVDERVLAGMVKGGSRDGVECLVAAVEAGAVTAEGEQRLNVVAALEVVQKRGLLEAVGG